MELTCFSNEERSTQNHHLEVILLTEEAWKEDLLFHTTKCLQTSKIKASSV